jgi:hypothetical protein
VYCELYQQLFGVEVCAASVRLARTKYFDESSDHPGHESEASSSSSSSSSNSGGGSTGYGGVLGVSAATAAASNQYESMELLPSLDGGGGGGGEPEAVYVNKQRRPPRLRQARTRFGANMISPMVQQHLGINRDRRVSVCACEFVSP